MGISPGRKSALPLSIDLVNVPTPGQVKRCCVIYKLQPLYLIVRIGSWSEKGGDFLLMLIFHIHRSQFYEIPEIPAAVCIANEMSAQVQSWKMTFIFFFLPTG